MSDPRDEAGPTGAPSAARTKSDAEGFRQTAVQAAVTGMAPAGGATNGPARTAASLAPSVSAAEGLDPNATEEAGLTDAQRNADWKAHAGEPGRAPVAVGGSTNGHSDRKSTGLAERNTGVVDAPRGNGVDEMATPKGRDAPEPRGRWS